jgi:hypothetical protein
VGNTGESLKALRNNARGTYAGDALGLEVEVEAIRIVLAADEAAVIILKFHWATSDWCACDALRLTAHDPRP